MEVHVILDHFQSKLLGYSFYGNRVHLIKVRCVCVQGRAAGQGERSGGAISRISVCFLVQQTPSERLSNLKGNTLTPSFLKE